MDAEKTQYYKDMLNRDRGQLFIKDGHVFAIVTFFIGDNDARYLKREPWTIIQDNPFGSTVYIDQFISMDNLSVGDIHHEFPLFLKWIKEKFINVKRAKWMRVNAEFRKHGIKEGVTSNVHTKSIKG